MSVHAKLYPRFASCPPPRANFIINKSHLVPSNAHLPEISLIEKNTNVIFVLVNSCTKCSNSVLIYGKNLEAQFSPKGFNVILVSKDSQAEIDYALSKSSWIHGRVISDSESTISQQLGSPDFPQVVVFEKGHVVFSGGKSESLRQSLHRMCLKYKIAPTSIDQDVLPSGAIPCAK